MGYDWILNCSPIRYLALSRPPAERQTTCLLTERAVVNAAYGTESKLRLDSIAARKLGRMGGGRFVRRRKVLAVRAPIRVEHRQPTTARLHDLVGEPLRSISRKLGGLGRSADESERMSRLRHRSQHLGTQRPHVVRVREQIPACRMRKERKNRRPKSHALSPEYVLLYTTGTSSVPFGSGHQTQDAAAINIEMGWSNADLPALSPACRPIQRNRGWLLTILKQLSVALPLNLKS